MTEIKREFGRHYLVELIGCETERIKFLPDVKSVFLNAAEKSQATIIDHHFHQFEPYGVSGVILIAWSHFALHTWPEEGYVAFDVFTCGEMYPELAIDELREGFGATDVSTRILPRGF
jgi:S-adenosylmethionine decarboxylase